MADLEFVLAVAGQFPPMLLRAAHHGLAAAHAALGHDAQAAEAGRKSGLLRHPASSTLAGLRATALHRLMEACQQTDPFKFLIYAELAGADIGPVG